MIHKKGLRAQNIRLVFLILIILISLTGISYGEYGNKKVILTAESAVVYCENTGTVVFEKNSKMKTDPGEVTKLMTALVAAQNLPLDGDIKVSRNAAGHDGDKLGLKKGERISVEDLLYGVLMIGSDDAAMLWERVPTTISVSL